MIDRFLSLGPVCFVSSASSFPFIVCVGNIILKLSNVYLSMVERVFL